MANIGDRVLAKWPSETEWWYPGVVVGIEIEGIEVQYDDGDRASLAEDELMPLAIGVGSRVYGRWQGGGTYYPGMVTAATGAAIHIEFDDGDKETTSVSMVRVNESDL
jgi:hypothetical protein